MRTAPLLFVWLVNALFACSGSNQQSNDNPGGSNSVAGSTGNGGSANSGGTTGATNGTGGAAAATGGRTGNGGTTSTGGSNGVGGSAVVGGALSSGGTKATGGTTNVNNATGGTIASTGGATSSGGTTSNGGTNTGGTSSKGGTSALGGSPSAGGATSAAGSPGTGGSTGNGGANTSGALYVSPTGDDSNPGTLAQPLKTIGKARDIVRTMNSAMTSDITVYLRGGTYPQTSTLTFANADSGSGGFYVKYMAYSNERPLITGGQPITGWTVSDATNNIYSASAGTTAFRQLYVNGVKAIRARSPNLLANNVANFNRLSGWDKTANNVQVPSSAVATWNNLTKVGNAHQHRLGGQHAAYCIDNQHGWHGLRDVPKP